MLVDKKINGPKGRIMGLHQAVDIDVIRRAAETAMQTGSQADLDIMYGYIRSVSLNCYRWLILVVWQLTIWFAA